MVDAMATADSTVEVTAALLVACMAMVMMVAPSAVVLAALKATTLQAVMLARKAPRHAHHHM